MLGIVCLRRLPVPWTIALAVGAAAESTAVFALLTAHVGRRGVFIALAVACLLAYWFAGRGAARLTEPLLEGADRLMLYLAGAVLACYTVLYLVTAMAPELEPDAIAYHLGFTSEYVRLARFPHRVGFYEMLPQGMEMLFVPAFAFGKHSAAKLVHFAFLLATVPLILQVGRRLQIPGGASLAAAALYFCAPVTGITGTSTYTDAGGVFFTLATFYLLLVWRDTRDIRYLAPAGITAGFCYAIKFPGGLVAVFALIFVVAVERRARWRPLALLAGMAALMAAPWALRSAIMTGDPFAPLFNRFFPNPYFHAAMEKDLAVALSSLNGVPWWRVPYELIVGGAFAGTMGPVFFLLPLGLLALGKRAGRLCWLAALLLAAPWLSNTGARFLMPALPFFALVLVMPLPRAALWACVAIQAVGCWPAMYALYHPGFTWRLQRIPWSAAVRIEKDEDYLKRIIPDAYGVARMVQDHTRPGDRIFALVSAPGAYREREVLEFWHSARAEVWSETLRAAAAPKYPLFDERVDFPPAALTGVRIRAPQPSPLDWRIHEIRFYGGDSALPPSTQWELRAWPNAWELPLAFDENMATFWRTWGPIQAGSYVEVDFDKPLTLTAVVMTTPTAFFSLPFDFYGREADGWHLLTNKPEVTPRPLGNVRMSATRAIRSGGYSYILANNGNEGNGILGADMAAHELEWGLDRAASFGPVILFHIK
jgi:hypothetical protein